MGNFAENITKIRKVKCYLIMLTMLTGWHTDGPVLFRKGISERHFTLGYLTSYSKKMTANHMNISHMP